ncbi:MAG TPA: sugar phosphate nucleotidyltransferase [Cyclobacteriaceae bacterium]|nr:sugar phosphate nucleotidyltransferase [Cyclobacteriaceae bacterium]
MSEGKKPSLLVMAAGMGSRYGGIKQIDGFGPNGETIMDYSLYDAIRAGFGKIVFVVREEILGPVKEMFLPKLEGKAEVHFVVQSLDKYVPDGLKPVERAKPWGTTHAMLCGKEAIQEPFAVINADDFYGRASFESLSHFLQNAATGNHAMVGYTLKNVLSDYGSVSRGVANQGKDGMLVSLSELTKIVKERGKVVSKEGDGDRELDENLKVSMNSWGFLPEVFDLSEKMFVEFVEKNIHNPKAEFYIALMVTELIKLGLGKVHIIPGGDTWFGVTYKEDKALVSDRIGQLIQEGVYPKNLWS